jgi:hypothetical protein
MFYIPNKFDEKNVKSLIRNVIHEYLFKKTILCDMSDVAYGKIRQYVGYDKHAPKTGRSKNEVRQYKRYDIVPAPIIENCFQNNLIPHELMETDSITVPNLVKLIIEHKKSKNPINKKIHFNNRIPVKKLIPCIDTVCGHNNHGLCSINPVCAKKESTTGRIISCSRWTKKDLGSPLVQGAENWWTRKE